MNIFYTNNNPVEAAKDLCKIHVNKMIIESAQLMCTAHRVIDNNNNPILYKATHIGRPCTKWVSESRSNYLWLLDYFKTLNAIYSIGRGRVHGTYKRCSEVISEAPVGIIEKGLTPVPQVMPDIFKSNNTCESYKKYLQAKYKEWVDRSYPLKVEWYLTRPTWMF